MTRVTFLLSKDPVTEEGGDVALSRLVMRLAADAFDVSAICLSGQRGDATLWPDGPALTRVPKPAIKPARLLADALRRRRSLVHVRFDTAELLGAIERRDTDVFVAEHSYMAETVLRSSRRESTGCVVNTHNSESLVWLANRGALGRVEAPRLVRDELRVARTADAVGCYDAQEAQMYRDKGVANAQFMAVTLPPSTPIDISSTPRRMVFFGRRDWPPNQEAFLNALRLWPRIADGIAGAELCIVGAKKPGAADPPYPDGVRELGFVDDLGQFLSGCRALMAPVLTGGGVRVKILDAASQGLPVVGTPVAVGSLDTVLGLPTFDDDDAFIAQCRRFLLDRDIAVNAGKQLFEINSEHWRRRGPHQSVEALLLAGVRP